MSSAKVVFKIKDESSIVPSISGVYAGIVLTSDKGPVNKPYLVTSENELISVYGHPNPSLGVSHYSASAYLSQGNKLWVVRSTHEDSKYSSALVRSKVTPFSQDRNGEINSDNFVVNPVIGGLTEAELGTYTFPNYITNREYELANVNLEHNYVKTDKLRVDSFSGLKIGDQLSITTETLANLNSDTDNVGENTLLYKVESLEESHEYFPKLKLKKSISTTANSTVEKLEAVSLILTEDVTDNAIVKVQDRGAFVAGDDVLFNGVRNHILNVTFVTDSEGLTSYHIELRDTITLTFSGSYEYYRILSYTGNPTVTRDATNSKEIIVSNSDYMTAKDLLLIGSATDVELVSKDRLDETINYVKVDQEVVPEAGQVVYKLLTHEIENRDAFLVSVVNQGEWGDKISVSILPSKNYTDVFNIEVYYEGLKVETWEVSRSQKLDGFGHQLYLTDKINDKSSYIKIIDNVNDVDINGVPEMPLFTNRSLWKQNPSVHYVDTVNNTAETLLEGHVEVKLSGVTGLSQGDKIRFFYDGRDSAEYTISSIDSVANTLILNRGIVETDIQQSYLNTEGVAVLTIVKKFDDTFTDSSAGIYNGIVNYAIKELSNLFYNTSLNSNYQVGGLDGKIVDSGSNLFRGGNSGSPVTVGDLINSLDKLKNKEETPVILLMDGGFTFPAYAQAIDSVAQAQGITHGYLSVPSSAERGSNFKSEIVQYKNSLNLNTSTSSLFSGWIKVFDSYNQKDIWVSPEGFAAASQSFTTRDYQIFYPASGWIRGKVKALDIFNKFSEGDRDFLADNQINPLRFKSGSGIAIWGNSTLLSRPSPLQLRSVAMLLIVIRQGLESVLEYKTFDLNNERTWSIVEGSINSFMRDEIKAKGGVYDYQVAVSKIITQSDIDNRRMPVFLGLKPTMDINQIDATISIFNSGVDIII